MVIFKGKIGLSVAACIILSVFLTSCMDVYKKAAPAEKTPEPEQMEAATVSTITQPDYEKYKMLINDNDYKLSLYEPDNGCYLGAYVLSNKKVNFSIEQYEGLVGKLHAIYVYNAVLGEEFPVNWVLECIANAKTPYFVLNMDIPASNEDYELIKKTAKEFGEFYIPIFVEFPAFDKNAGSKKYIEAFKKTRKLFAEYASNAAFVWSVKKEYVNDCDEYYPGDVYTDWVSIQMFEPLDNYGRYEGNILDYLDVFYNKFQKRKPIFVSRFAVSHLNSRDFVYKTEEAAAEIARVYAAVKNEYKRVKGIIYYDFNGMDFQKQDDFTITGEQLLLDKYKHITFSDYFISELDMMSNGDLSGEIYTSEHYAYKSGEHFYLCAKSLQDELGIFDFSGSSDFIVINDTLYYNINGLEEIKDKVTFIPLLYP